MIKNVVFDFGQVLIKYDPDYMASKFVDNSEDLRLLSDVLFDRLYWDKLDDATITDEQVVAFSCERLPERLHEACRKAYYNWIYNLPPIEGMWELVRKIKRKYGVKTFVLSNVGTYLSDNRDAFEIFSEMEKCIFSAEVGHIKPNRDMFEYLTKTCNILPEETVFIDDNAKNIAGAEAFGIKGYLFDGDAHRLEEYLDKLLRK
jgi:putative hydrolase of the HAD superfamily